MRFITVRDLRTKTAQIRKDLAKDRDMVVTANGRPFAVLCATTPDDVEDIVQSARRARWQRAVKGMRDWAKEEGLDGMTIAEIDAVIARVRGEREQTGTSAE